MQPLFRYSEAGYKNAIASRKKRSLHPRAAPIPSTCTNARANASDTRNQYLLRCNLSPYKMNGLKSQCKESHVIFTGIQCDSCPKHKRFPPTAPVWFQYRKTGKHHPRSAAMGKHPTKKMLCYHNSYVRRDGGPPPNRHHFFVLYPQGSRNFLHLLLPCEHCRRPWFWIRPERYIMYF